MVNNVMSQTNLRLLLPETLWLEPEHYRQARQVSHPTSPEAQQWQAYLTVLGKCAFADWLQERLLDYPVQVNSHQVPGISYLKIGDFKLFLIAVEQVLDEVIQIPKVAIEQPDLAAHFYVVLEVLEDQEQVIIRGFLRHDELITGQNSLGTLPTDEWCQVPLMAFDGEINHLVFYIQQLEPVAIPLPSAAAEAAEGSAPGHLSSVRIRLSQWLQGMLDEGWQTVEALVNPAANLAWSTRNTSLNARGGKLINFGLQLDRQSVVLLITVTPESEGKIGIGAQVLPAGGAQVLPPQLKLALLSGKDDKILQEVESRAQDNYIQLKSFRGKPGTSFSIEVSLNDIRVREAFEL